MIDFPYKILKIEDYLTNEDYNKLKKLVDEFFIPNEKFKLHYKSLTWSENVVNKLIEYNADFYYNLIKKEYLSINDFLFLVDFNNKNNFNNKDYFNFCMMYRENKISNDDTIYFFENEIENLYKKAYSNIIKKIFNKSDIEDKHIKFGHLNVYPKNSFITLHSDETTNNDRLFTTLFFINSNRKKEDGSLLKIYEPSQVIEIIPDFNTVVIIEQKKYNYSHEVTENLIDNVRYSIYTPFDENLFNLIIN